MRMWIILLTLYSTNGQPAENIIVPGVYTQSQCVAVKAIMDQDHDTRLNTRGPGSAKLYPTLPRWSASTEPSSWGSATDMANKGEVIRW